MNAQEKSAFEDKIYAYIGKEMAPPTPALDAVNKPMIRHWCEVMGDNNPVYTDEAAAAASSKKSIIAPPTMLQAWSLEGYPMHNPSTDESELDTQRLLHKVFDDHGYTGVLGTNCTQEYFRDVTPGDLITAHTVIDTISEQKATARGIGYFIETVTTYTDQNGEDVGRMVFRVLKFVPNESNQAAAAPADSGAPAPATRIKSPRGHDNAWWWDALEKDKKLMIQRCTSCNTLRHPARSMCGECQSTKWDSIESTMKGEIFSFTQLHYPKFPGYQYPLICAVISLEEGTRIVANITDCDPKDVAIGKKVTGKIEEIDAETTLPMFYLA
ncbi:MAG: MaoC family dehydratase N-terminal domain-containing protein [Pseudomonadota bacterium]